MNSAIVHQIPIMLFTLLALLRLTVVGGAETFASIPIGKDIFGETVELPLVGAGTWQYNDTIAYQSLCKAFDAGYRLVDTAYGYRNQKGVGMAIKDCWHGNRKDLFVLTKIPGGLSREEVLAAHQQNLWELQLDYVDHVMTHFPSDWDESPDRATSVRRQETWLALEEIYFRGQARSIGVSHYCESHIDDVLDVATIMPSLNQVEYHVGSGDVDSVIRKCRAFNITFMSFSPLCGPCQLDSPDDSLIHGKLVSEIAQNYPGKMGSQVALRFIVQQALVDGSYIGGVIPKSNNLDHIRSNMNIFDFNLSDEDMDRLKAANKPSAEGGDCEVL